MTLNNIRTLFEQIISSSKWWSKVQDSEFVSYIITFVAQIYFRSVQASSRRLQEAFLSMALKMSSILAHAESRGYVARKRIPMRKAVLITNNSNVTQYIPAFTKFYSSDTSLHFLIETPVTIEPNSEYKTELIQAKAVYFESSIDEEKKYIEKKLDIATSSEIASISISITVPSGQKEKWEQSYLFRNTTPTSKSYVEFYTPTQQLGIRFGNGVSGLIPPLGSIIHMECLISEGFTELSEGLSLDILDNDQLSDALSIKTNETLIPGEEREDMESIRNNALYHTNYDNTVVLDGDYEFFTKLSMTGLTWFRVWGEKEQEKLTNKSDLDYSCRVYLSAYHPELTQDAIMQSLESLYSTVKTLNIKYTPVHCNLEPFTISLSGKILSTKKVDDITNEVKRALKEAFSDQSALHNGDISYDVIWEEIKKLDVFVRYKLDAPQVDLDIPPRMDTFRFLDVDNSIINITY